MAEKYDFMSPYNYVLNNPINYIDPDGQEPITLTILAIAGIATLVGTSAYAINYSHNKNGYSSGRRSNFYYNMRALKNGILSMAGASKPRSSTKTRSFSEKEKSLFRKTTGGGSNKNPNFIPHAIGGASIMGYAWKYWLSHKEAVNVGHKSYSVDNFSSFYYNQYIKSEPSLDNLFEIIQKGKMPNRPTKFEYPKLEPLPSLDPNKIPKPVVTPLNPGNSPNQPLPMPPVPLPPIEPSPGIPDVTPPFNPPPHLPKS